MSCAEYLKSSKLNVAGRLAADEPKHYTALTQALGGSLPTAALSYGA